MFVNKLVGRLHFYKVFLFLVASGLVYFVSLRKLNWRWSVPFDVLVQTDVAGSHSCPNVLDKMVIGHWSVRNYSSAELEEVEDGLRRLRTVPRIPKSLQRKDGGCGNITYEGLYWTRAVCNPKGPSPCCYNNICVNKTVQECKCPQCYDFRWKIHAELADWIPDDPNCEILQFDEEKRICSALGNTTLYLIGDSYMRHLCISVLHLIYRKDPSKVYTDNADPALRKKCDSHYRFVAECSPILRNDILTCGNTTKIHCQEIRRAEMSADVIKLLHQLRGQNNSWFFYGIGPHDNFNISLIQTKMLEPLLSEVAKSDWPKFVWYEPHADGLLKTPNIPEQLGPSRVIYNAKVKAIMDQHKLPVISFYQLTRDVISFDGSHYGKGVNDVKVQIILNYLLEQRMKLHL